MQGRIIARLKRSIHPNFLAENRHRPVNHVCKMLEIKNFQNNDDYISLTNETSKTLYRNLSRINNAYSIAETSWERFFNLNFKFNWDNIWKDGGCKLLDHEDRDLWFKLKLMKMKITPDDTCPLCGVEKETIEHLFIYCQKHFNAWIFVEVILRKYTNNKMMYINDINRILGKYMNNIALCVIGKLHRVIWSVRCEIVKNPTITKCPDIMTKYINVLKGFIFLENKSLPEHEFKDTYAHNQVLCTIKDGVLTFPLFDNYRYVCT